MRKQQREKTKLVLNPQTLRNLEPEKLNQVVGGSASGGTWSAGASWFEGCHHVGTCIT